MKKNFWIVAGMIVIVAVVTTACIWISESTLARTAQAQKNVLKTDNHVIQPIGTNEEAETSAAPPAPSGVPDNSKLSERLEKAGVNGDMLNAMNNPIPKKAEEALTKLLDQYDKAPEGSDERIKLINQINQMAIPGVNEGLTGEMQKAEAVQTSKKLCLSCFGLDVSNWINQMSVQYMAASLYAENNGRSFWNIEGGTDKEWYSLVIDAKTGDVTDAHWEPQGPETNDGQKQATPEQMQAAAKLARNFAARHLQKKDAAVQSFTPDDKASIDSVTEDASISVKVALSDKSSFAVSVNVTKNVVLGFAKKMPGED